MKRMISILLPFILLICLFACGKQTEQLTNQYIETSISNSNDVEESQDTVDSEIGGDFEPCNHIYNYHQIDGWLLDYVDSFEPGLYHKYADLFLKTEDFNRRAFMDYFGIPKEDYWKIYNKDSILAEPDAYNIEYYNPDVWFSDDYYKDPLFIQASKIAPEENSVTIKPKDDTIHTDRYFTICESLIDYVGEKEFNEFRNKYGGTADFNILKFVDEFDISRDDFEKLTQTHFADFTFSIYNSDYVYGTPEMQKEYFEKHILNTAE